MNAPRTWSTVSASTRANARRIVDSSGPAPVTPSVVNASVDWWAAHSPMATNERAPASTPANPTARIAGRPWRTPRGSRASGTDPNSVNRSGRCALVASDVAAQVACGTAVGEDGIDGCGPDWWRREQPPSSHMGHIRHTRHTAAGPTKPQVTPSQTDFAGALGYQ